MKSFAFFLILLQILQNTNANTLQAKYRPKNPDPDILKVDSLQHNSITINHSDTEYIKSLKERLKQSSDTISNLNSMVSAFGTAIAIIGIFIGILTIGLPIITYHFGIKPSQNAIKELENKVDEKVATYIQRNQEMQAQKAIDNLQSDEQFTVYSGIAYLQSNIASPLTESQLLKIGVLINKKEIQDNIKLSLLGFLVFQDSEISSMVFKNILFDEKSNSNFKNIALQYIVRSKEAKQFSTYIQIIERAVDRRNMYYGLLEQSKNLNFDLAIQLLNSKEIISLVKTNLSNEEWEKFKQEIDHNFKDNAKEEYKKTCFFK